jgi:hypothetical protein
MDARGTVTHLNFGDDLLDHPSSEELAAYVHGALTGASRGVFEEHLVKCRACRRDVTLARRMLGQRRARNPRRVLVAAAAAVVFFFVVSRLPTWSGGSDEPVRSERPADLSGTATTIGVVSPANGSTIEPGPVTFAWRSQPGQLLYQLSLTDAGGRELWSARTTDTTLSLPGSIALERGRPYFWTVDALAADGVSLTTRTQRFSTPR